MTKMHPCSENKTTFFEKLKTAEGLDLRDNRGKRLELAVILCGLVMALLSGRDGNLSSLQHHLENPYGSLWQALQLPDYDRKVISRSHLPIALRKVSATVLGRLIFADFGVKLSKKQKQWFALDGKEMRGSIKKKTRGEALGQAVIYELAYQSNLI